MPRATCHAGHRHKQRSAALPALGALCEEGAAFFVERNESLAAAFAVSDADPQSGYVDIITTEPNDFTEPQACVQRCLGKPEQRVSDLAQELASLFSAGRDRSRPIDSLKWLHLSPCIGRFDCIVPVAVVQDRAQQVESAIRGVLRFAQQIFLV